MAETDITATTTTNLTNEVSDYSPDAVSLDVPSEVDETTYDFPNFKEWLKYYKQIPELKRAIDSLATYVVGKGFDADISSEMQLEHADGMGKETILSILFNLFATKKFNGDAFAEIIKDGNILINLKPISPDTMRIVVDRKGRIKRYEQRSKVKGGKWVKFDKDDILHLKNDPICDSINGTSVVEVCKWVIDARNEAMADWRRMLHRSTIRVIEVDTDDDMTTIKTEYAEAIKNGEVLLVPKGNYGFPDAPINYIDPQNWIQYLENFFYQAVGVPRVIATSENFTEASSKVGYLTFEPVYTKEQVMLEAELWNQLGIKLKFNRPPSLAGNVQEDEAKDGPIGFQANDTQAGVGEDGN